MLDSISEIDRRIIYPTTYGAVKAYPFWSTFYSICLITFLFRIVVVVPILVFYLIILGMLDPLASGVSAQAIAVGLIVLALGTLGSVFWASMKISGKVAEYSLQMFASEHNLQEENSKLYYPTLSPDRERASAVAWNTTVKRLSREMESQESNDGASIEKNGSIIAAQQLGMIVLWLLLFLILYLILGILALAGHPSLANLDAKSMKLFLLYAAIWFMFSFTSASVLGNIFKKPIGDIFHRYRFLESPMFEDDY